MFKWLQRVDAFFLLQVKKLHCKTTNRIMSVVTHLGTGGLVWFLLSIPLIFTKSTRNMGLNLLLGIFITWLVGEITIKRIVGRVRPSEQLPEEEQIVKRPKYYSFPSGHTASSFSVVGVLLLNQCSLYILIPVVILAFLIGFSRLYLRVHYFTDVVCGMLLGFGCGCGSVPLFRILQEFYLNS